MKPDEMEIVRAVSVDLGGGLVFALTYQYHTEKDPADPSGRRNDRSKSRYRMLGRVEKVDDLEKKAAELHLLENRTGPWEWPDDPSWKGRILYMKDSSKEGRSNWIRLKLRKAVSPEEALRIFAGYKKYAKKAAEARRKGGKKPAPEDLYTVFSRNAVYDVHGYACSDGTTLDVTDFDALRAKVGQNVWKEIRMKLSGPNPLCAPADGANPQQGEKA